MKKIYIHLMMLAAMVVAGAAMTSCSKEEVATGKFKMSINATKGGDNSKQLNLDGHTLNATWAKDEVVEVYKGEVHIGTLTAQSAGASTTLDGEIEVEEIEAGNKLTLKFCSPNYSTQDGTLTGNATSIDKVCDYATATVTVASVGGGVVRTEESSAPFVNQQAIVKFTLTDNASTPADLDVTQLVVSDGTNAYIVTPASGTDVIYVAIPGISGQTVTLIATVGDDTYTYEKSGVTFANGRYYEITVKMTQAPALNLTSPAVGQVIGDDGKNYDYASLPGGVTAVAKICYVSGSTGLALALADEGQMIWSTAISTCAAHTPAFTGGTWKLATHDEWTNMITAAGGYTALRDGFSSVGGSNLQSGSYWSSTEKETWYAWSYNFVLGSWNDSEHKYFDEVWVRACLAF